MEIIAVGDMHFGKELWFLQPNPFLKSNKEKLESIWASSTASCIDFILDDIKKPLHFIFLGDLIDNPYIDDIWINKIKNIFLKITERQGIVSVILGNHDTNTTRLNTSKLSKIEIPNVYFYDKPFSYEKILFLPYRKPSRLLNSLKNIKEKEFKYLFTHNNIYCNSFFMKTPMFHVKHLREILHSPKMIVYNGHLHRNLFDRTSGYFQPGSTAPTSFKEYPNAYGFIHISKNNKHRYYRNNRLFFISISNKASLDAFKKFVINARKYKAKLCVKYSTLLKNNISYYLKYYKDVVVGVQESI